MQIIPHSIWGAFLFAKSCTMPTQIERTGMGDLEHVSNQIFSRE